MRFRDIFLGLGSLLVLALLFLTDPAANVIGQLPIGASTINVLINLVISLLYVGLLHCSRKALVDYLPSPRVCKADDGSTLPVFTEQDVCIIGAPAFGGRVPAFAIERIKKLEESTSRRGVKTGAVRELPDLIKPGSIKQ